MRSVQDKHRNPENSVILEIGFLKHVSVLLSSCIQNGNSSISGQVLVVNGVLVVDCSHRGYCGTLRSNNDVHKLHGFADVCCGC